MELYIDDDGYVCFKDGGIFWALHYNGWEAFLPDEDEPCYGTDEHTFPTDDDLAEAYKLYEEQDEL